MSGGKVNKAFVSCYNGRYVKKQITIELRTCWSTSEKV